MKKFAKIFTGTLALAISAMGWANEKPAVAGQETQPAQVMLFGTFHFSNPGRDLVKSKVINVLAPDNQRYLEELTDKIASHSPTHLMLECDPSIQNKINKKFQSYLIGNHQLGVSETQQLGFRIAAKAGLQGVICYDENKVHWKGAELADYMSKYAPERKKIRDAEIERLSKLDTKHHQSLSLSSLFQLHNDPMEDRGNMGFYIMENDIGAGREFAGAEASASWWHRNFRMYANIQSQAQPGTKVIAIAGAGHTAIMKTLLASDLQRQAWDVNDYL